jgi:hypothetical protein
VNIPFTAAATTLVTSTVSMDTSTLAGNGTAAESCITLERVNDFTVYGAHVGADVVTTPNITQPKVYAARLNCDAASSVMSDPAGLVSSIGNISSGVCSVAFNSGKFATGAYCMALGSSLGFLRAATLSSTTGTEMTCRTHDNSVCTNFDFDLMCWGY